MQTFTGSQLLIRLLERQGISTIAGIPGGANLPMYDALSQTTKIRHVLARHEQGAGFIAQGMARVLGRPQVCFATSGPGATNVLTAIADAKLDSVPVVCITGQVPLGLIGTDAFQEVDTFGMSIPITKYNVLVRDAMDLLEIIPKAFRVAASGRPGPVLVDIPKDIQNQVVQVDRLSEPGEATETPEIDESLIARAAEMINEAKQPVLYLGGGIMQSNAAELARKLAEKSSLPTTMTLMGLGAIPSGHPLSMHMLGMHARRSTNMILEECDLLICVGARFDDRATGKLCEFCPDAKIIHIDIDASELNKLKTAQVAIQGDAKEALEMLLPRVSQNARQTWLARVAHLEKRHPTFQPGVEDPRMPHGLIRAVAQILGDEAIVTTDVGQHQMWTAQAYPVNRCRQLLTSGGLGTMGFGLPTAIGAALAAPDRPVVCFSGDGSLLMNIQELATAVEQGVNVKVVLLNNNALGLVHQQQDLFYGKRLFASKFNIDVDFVKIAEGFGAKTTCLGKSGDPMGSLKAALLADGVGLIHAPVDVWERVFPMVPPGAANRTMIGGELEPAGA